MADQTPKNPEKHHTYLPTDKKSTKPFHNTPMLDQLESGPWPSFVTGLKRLANESNMMVDLLGQLEHSYKTRLGYWKGGTVSVFGYGGGIIPRFTELMNDDGTHMFPASKEFHTVRVQPPAGNFYDTRILRQLSNSWNKYGSGLIAFHGQTGNIMFIGTDTENTQHFFDEINSYGFDLGGAGPCVRTGMYVLVPRVANSRALTNIKSTLCWSIIFSMICIVLPFLINSNSKSRVALTTA